jgi:segregation and condensation protein B
MTNDKHETKGTILSDSISEVPSSNEASLQEVKVEATEDSDEALLLADQSAALEHPVAELENSEIDSWEAAEVLAWERVLTNTENQRGAEGFKDINEIAGKLENRSFDLEQESSEAEVAEGAPHVSVEEIEIQGTSQNDFSTEGESGFEENSDELEGFESAEIEEEEFVETERIQSIVESLLFATDKPQSLAALKQAFKGTNVTGRHIKKALDTLAVEYAGAQRGIVLDEVHGGYQLRTKIDNMEYLRRLVKARTFRVSGPALEVLAITAYKQPMVKSEVDEIRGVESGHLMRGLMDRGLICFNGKSDLPGKPMLYGTTKKFLEIFGLRNLKELPSLSEIDDLLPEGIGDELIEKEKLSDITESMSQTIGNTSYSEGEEELEKINSQLAEIDTSSEFFETEKQRERDRRDQEKAQDIRERITLEEDVEARDLRWLERYEQKLEEARTLLVDKVDLAEPVGYSEVVEFSAETENNPAEVSGDVVAGPIDLPFLVNEVEGTLSLGGSDTELKADVKEFSIDQELPDGLDAFARAEIEAAVKAYEDERSGVPVDEVAESMEFGPSQKDLGEEG